MKKKIKEYLVSYVIDHVDIDDNKCWLWTSDILRDGYGSVHLHNLPYYVRQHFLNQGLKYRIAAHRLSHMLFNGNITKTKPLVLHSCNQRSCVNPSHLRIGTQKENMKDASELQKLSGITLTRKKKTPEWIKAVNKKILKGQSFYSICDQEGGTMTSVRYRARLLQEKGHFILQFKE